MATLGLKAACRQACYARADATGGRLTAHKSKVKQLFNRTRGQGFTTAAVWGDPVGTFNFAS